MLSKEEIKEKINYVLSKAWVSALLWAQGANLLHSNK